MTAGVISKPFDAGVKEHHFIRADLHASKDAAEAYAKEVVSAKFEEPGDADLVHKILGDLQNGGIEISEHRLRNKMKECLAEAKEQGMTE